MIWTAWNNGRHHKSGAGYGFKVSVADRRKFRRRWGTVVIVLPIGRKMVKAIANIDKDSFWSGTCRELISRRIGQWLISGGYGHWDRGAPPRFKVRQSGPARFEVLGEAA